MSQIQLILVEDDTDLRETLVEALAIHGYPVIGVGTGLAFYQEMGRRSFDIAIIDLGLPDLDGYDLVEFVRRNTAAGVIVITSRDDIADRVKGYDSGADLYLTKPVNTRELAAAIASIAARRHLSATVSVPPKIEFWRLFQDSWRLTAPGGEEFSLNQKEFQLLMELVAENGKPVARETLLIGIYGGNNVTMARSLEVLVSRLRIRFREQCGRTLPLQTVVGVGYRFAGTLAAI